MCNVCPAYSYVYCLYAGYSINKLAASEYLSLYRHRAGLAMLTGWKREEAVALTTLQWKEKY